MSERLDLAIDVLDELAENKPEVFYHIMVREFTVDAQHAAMYMDSMDFTQLKRFVKLVDQLRKEK